MQADLFNPKIKEFTLSFFKKIGAEASFISQDLIKFKIPFTHREAFEGAQVLTCAFSLEEIKNDKEAQLVIFGSYILNILIDESRKLGFLEQKTLATNEALVPKKNIEFPVKIRRGSVRKQKEGVTFLPYLKLNYRIRYHSDEVEEELTTLIISQHGKRVMPDEFLKIIETNASEGTDSINGNVRSKHAFTDCLDAANQELKRKITTKLEIPQKNAKERLEQELIRLEGYYAELENEAISSRSERREQVRERLHFEKQRRIDEEIDKHSLKVVYSLINAQIIYYPYYSSEYVIEANGISREEELIEDLIVKRDLSSIYCEKCSNLFEVGDLCFKSHFICEKCSDACTKCSKSFCYECGIKACSHCGKPFCADCSTHCSACSKEVCNEVSQECRICKKSICPNCEKDCAGCGKHVCKTHVESCKICEEPFCSDESCRTTCSSCNGIVCKNHKAICQSCGKISCRSCVGQCRDCNKEVCASHIKTCAECNERLCEVCQTKCNICGEISCKDHFSTCGVCGNQTCSSSNCHGKCAECSKVVCSGDYKICQECSKPVCKDDYRECHMDLKTRCKKHTLDCPICDKGVCKKHTRNCSYCEEVACAECFDFTGRCLTCRNLTVTEDFNAPLLEALKNDPKIPIDKIKKWAVGWNSKNLVLMGEGSMQRFLFVFDKQTKSLTHWKKLNALNVFTSFIFKKKG